MSLHRVSDPGVGAVFAAYPQEMRYALEELRTIILDVAAAIKGVGQVEESLKWGQPAYRPIISRTGTTLRIGPLPNSDTEYALFFHCQTSLAADFRALYPDEFRIVDDRALIFSLGDVLPEIPLRHCIAIALTYHQREGAANADADAAEESIPA
jgi:hypothetical protein